MWEVLFFALFAVVAGSFVYIYRRQREMIVALRRAREKILLEETRVFDFLHGLGAALSDTSRPSDLHVLIVEGALRILGAHGGALYLVDRASETLRPALSPLPCARMAKPPVPETTLARLTGPPPVLP